MEYREGKINRVFIIRFDDGEDCLQEIVNLSKKENVRNGWFQVIGGLREVDLVTGPRKPVIPPEPVWEKMQDGRETLGCGSVFRDENNEPRIHLHSALGLHGDTLTGCLRQNSKVYLVMEVLLMEISGFTASRPWYPEGGFNRLSFSG
ncbi:MAG: PPC domain-containing DNA-binding protein [Thermodesulfobacteriota bacterium]